MVADCFHEAAYIYLHSTLERMAQNIDTYRIPPAWRSFISVSESDARNRCLARIDSSCLDGHCEYSALTFPLFIAGCESGSHAERDIVARSLGALETSFGFGNVGRVRELLGMLWDGDTTVHWQDMLEELRWDLILA